MNANQRIGPGLVSTITNGAVVSRECGTIEYPPPNLSLSPKVCRVRSKHRHLEKLYQADCD